MAFREQRREWVLCLVQACIALEAALGRVLLGIRQLPELVGSIEYAQRVVPAIIQSIE